MDKMEAKFNSNKPWLFVENLEMSQMIFEDILDRVEEELSTKKILDNLMARAKENMETQHLNMKLDKPGLFVEDFEMCQMVLGEILDKVEENSTKETFDDLDTAKQRNEILKILKVDTPWCAVVEEDKRIQENMETKHLNMKLDKPGLFVEDLEMCQMVLGEILDRVEENSTKETLDDMDTAKQRNEILKILRIDKSLCAVGEEDERLQENMETKHLNMKLDEPCFFVEDFEMCQMVLGEILDRVEEENMCSTKETVGGLTSAKVRNEILKVLKIDKPGCAVGEENERLQGNGNMETYYLNMTAEKSGLFVEDLEMCQMVLGEILDRVEEENMYSTKETVGDLATAKENMEAKHMKIKLDEPYLFVEDLGTCQDIINDLLDRVEIQCNTKKTLDNLMPRAKESDKISMKFEKAWRVDDEEMVKDIINNLLERTEEGIERKRMKTLMMKVLEELKLKVPIVLSVSYPPEVADHANLKELIETKQESKFHKSRNNDKNMADVILGRVERQCKMKKNLDGSHDLVNDLTGKDEKCKILKLDKTCHVKDEQMVKGIINNLMSRVGEEIDRKRIRKLMANVQEELKSRVSIIPKHAYSMESYSQKINFENVQNNKLHYIGSERKEFCQLKVHIVLSVSYPSEVADHANLRKLIETKQESKYHKSRNNDMNMADAILGRVERQCNMKKNLDDLTGKDEKSKILKLDKTCHFKDEQMVKGIINNLMGRVGEEIDRKRIGKLIANVQEELKSRVSIIHKHAYSMESYSQKINFENVQNNKPHDIGSEKKEFCQLKVPIVLSVSYPSEVADHANLKEIIETEQESKSHKSNHDNKNKADAILDRVERQCNMKNLDDSHDVVNDLTGRDEKCKILKLDKACHVKDEQMSRVSIIHEHTCNMESCSQKINFENVQKNIKPHYIVSERKEFCQSIHAEFMKRVERHEKVGKVKSMMAEVYQELKMKVPIVRSVSNPFEDANQANLKENNETKQYQKCHKNKAPRRKYFKNLKKRVLRLFHCCVSPSLANES